MLSLDLINDGLSRPIQLPCVLFSTLIMIIPFPFKLNGSRVCVASNDSYSIAAAVGITSNQFKSIPLNAFLVRLQLLLYYSSGQHNTSYFLLSPHSGYCHDNFHVFISFAHFSMQSHRHRRHHHYWKRYFECTHIIMQNNGTDIDTNECIPLSFRWVFFSKVACL